MAGSPSHIAIVFIFHFCSKFIATLSIVFAIASVHSDKEQIINTMKIHLLLLLAVVAAAAEASYEADGVVSRDSREQFLAYPTQSIAKPTTPLVSFYVGALYLRQKTFIS